MKQKRSKTAPKRVRYVLKLHAHDRFYLVRVNYGHGEYKAAALLSDHWLPDQVARSLRQLADMVEAIPLKKGIPARRGNEAKIKQ
jgi:hypothetical protein